MQCSATAHFTHSHTHTPKHSVKTQSTKTFSQNTIQHMKHQTTLPAEAVTGLTVVLVLLVFVTGKKKYEYL